MKKVQYFITCLIAIMIYTTANAEVYSAIRFDNSSAKELGVLDKENSSTTDQRVFEAFAKRGIDIRKSYNARLEDLYNRPAVRTYQIEGLGDSKFDKQINSLYQAENLQDFRTERQQDIRNFVILIVCFIAVLIGVISCSVKRPSKKFVDMKKDGDRFC